MIEYINTNRVFTGEAYDETYSQDPDRFGHTITFRALDDVFDRMVNVDQPMHAFDLGCGQGQVIEYVRGLVRERSPHLLNESAFYGIDISEVAIQQCEARQPGCRWIADSFQDFLERPGSAKDRGTFDLIINKGGLTAVRSADDYRAMLEGIRSLLRDGGIYLFIQYKQFYQVWSNEHCEDWQTDIFELAEDVFGSAERIADDSAYICVSRKNINQTMVKRDATPRRIVFRMDDGSEQRVFVSGDELMAERLQRVRARSNRHEVTAFELPADANERDEQRRRERVEQARAGFAPGRLSVLIGTGRVRITGVKAIDVYPGVYQSLRGEYNIIDWPGMISTTRHLCKVAAQWSFIRPDIAVIGPGLEDFKRSTDPYLPIVDADEFRFRLDWVIKLLMNEAKCRVVYCATPPMFDFEDERNGFAYRVTDGEAFAAIAAEVCEDHNAGFVNIARNMTTQLSREKQAAMVGEQVAAMLSAKERVPCAR